MKGDGATAARTAGGFESSESESRLKNALSSSPRIVLRSPSFVRTISTPPSSTSLYARIAVSEVTAVGVGVTAIAGGVVVAGAGVGDGFGRTAIAGSGCVVTTGAAALASRRDERTFAARSIRIGSVARATSSRSSPSPSPSSTSESPSPANVPMSVVTRTARSQRTSPSTLSNCASAASIVTAGTSRVGSTLAPSTGRNKRTTTSSLNVPLLSARCGTDATPLRDSIVMTRPSRKNIITRGSVNASCDAGSGSKRCALYCCASRPSSSAT